MLSLLYASIPIPYVCKISFSAFVLVFTSVSCRPHESAISDGTERQAIAPNPRVFWRQAGVQHIALAPIQDWGICARCPTFSLTPPHSNIRRGLEGGQSSLPPIGFQKKKEG